MVGVGGWGRGCLSRQMSRVNNPVCAQVLDLSASNGGWRKVYYEYIQTTSHNIITINTQVAEVKMSVGMAFR